MSRSRRFPLQTSERAAEIAVLFGVVRGKDTGRDPLEELAGLAEAAGVLAVETLVQRLDRPHPATFIGSGKVEELREVIVRVGANLVLADMDLSPAQVRNLTEELGVRVVDRSELIMDIFACRARTSQAKIQVELAQLKYALPRLRGQWSHLDRYVGGGVGTRGPGDNQIETVRRIVRRRIRDLERRLSVFEKRKRLTLAGRKNMKKVALAGYTNTGKSTLFNALTDGDVEMADRLFETLDTRTKRWPLGKGEQVLLSDTVGFIRDLPHDLVASFHATLEEVIEADLVIHVVDATDPDAVARMKTVEDVMESLGAGSVPVMVVFNKVDAVTDAMELQVLLNGWEGEKRCISARTGEGLAEVEDLVRESFAGRRRRYQLSVPLQSGRALALIQGLTTVLEQEVGEEDLLLLIEVEEGAVGSLQSLVSSEGLELVVA